MITSRTKTTVEDDELTPVLTIFAIPKSFKDTHIALIQRNAIASWAKLPRTEVILMGNDPGVAEIANEFDIEHVADLAVNESGTPLLDDAFAKANLLANAPVMAYVNSDIILMSDIEVVADRFANEEMEKFLMIGRRIDTDIDEPLNFAQANWAGDLREFVLTQGKLAPVVCKDYFIFPKGQHASIPRFAVGRGNWDNWMVANANKNEIPVIEATNVITAIHQNHDYGHLKGGRMAAYVTGKEARANRKSGWRKQPCFRCSNNFTNRSQWR